MSKSEKEMAEKSLLGTEHATSSERSDWIIRTSRYTNQSTPPRILSGHCRHCDKSFDQIRDLALHMMNVHAEFGRNILGCMVANCGYTYKNMNYLREYIGVTHTKKIKIMWKWTDGKLWQILVAIYSLLTVSQPDIIQPWLILRMPWLLHQEWTTVTDNTLGSQWLKKKMTPRNSDSYSDVDNLLLSDDEDKVRRVSIGLMSLKWWLLK